MLKRRPSSGFYFALQLAVVTIATTFSVAQLPDAPRPQNNAPPASTPDVTAPPPGSDDTGPASSKANPPEAGNTRTSDDPTQPLPATNPQAPPPGSQGIKTVPTGKNGNAPGNDFDQLFTLEKDVNFI